MSWQERQWVCIYDGPDNDIPARIQDILKANKISVRALRKTDLGHSQYHVPRPMFRSMDNPRTGHLVMQDLTHLEVRQRDLERAKALVGSVYKKLTEK